MSVYVSHSKRQLFMGRSEAMMSDEPADETGKADPGKRSDAQAQIERLREQVTELMKERLLDMSDRIQGAAREFGGRVQETVGNLS